MVPPLADCYKNPPLKNEVWDRCVRKSSIGIGLGSLIGGVSSLFFGTSGVVLSMSMCVTWAVKHCRALFREEEEEAKRRAEELSKPCPEPLPPCILPCPDTEDLEPIEQEIDIAAIEESETAEEEPCQPSSTFSFPPVFPMPDRPFGRIDTDDSSSKCTCDITESKDNIDIKCTCPLPLKDADELKDFYIECKGNEPKQEPPCFVPPEPPAEPCPPPVNFEEDVCTCGQNEPIKSTSKYEVDPKCTCECTCSQSSPSVK